MLYLGSKARHADEIINVIDKYRLNRPFVDLFVGGGNVVCKVKGERVANDHHPELIAMYRALQAGWRPPQYVSESYYQEIKNNRTAFPPELVGYVGFSLSFGGKWFGGYRRDSKDCNLLANEHVQSKRAYRRLIDQLPGLQDVRFYNESYWNVPLPANGCIYCDPPYLGTTKYSSTFDSNRFWQWARDRRNEGYLVFISEYTAPDDFTCIWEKQIGSSLHPGKKSTEKLWV